MIWTNYHSHCHYCDGKNNPEKYIKKAIEQKMMAYGFSSHAPLPFECDWTMSATDTLNYIQELKFLKERYRDQIEIYIGMEVDFVPGISSVHHPQIANLDLDYTIGSIHFIPVNQNAEFFEIDGSHTSFNKGLSSYFRNDIMEVIKIYFHLTRQMLLESPPDVLGHLDKIKIQNEEDKYYHEKSRWYHKQLDKTLEVIKESGVIVEVNTRGIYKKKSPQPYPSPWILEKIHRMGIPITLSSDAHHPDEIIKEFGNTASLLRNIGFKKLHVLLEREWIPVSFDQAGLRLAQHA